jgi:hypothetical protein
MDGGVLTKTIFFPLCYSLLPLSGLQNKRRPVLPDEKRKKKQSEKQYSILFVLSKHSVDSPWYVTPRGAKYLFQLTTKKILRTQLEH